MNIKRENLPLGEDKDFTALPQPPHHTKTGAKNQRMGTTHNKTYWGSGQKIRVHLRSCTLSPAKLPDKQGKDADDTYTTRGQGGRGRDGSDWGRTPNGQLEESSRWSFLQMRTDVGLQDLMIRLLE